MSSSSGFRRLLLPLVPVYRLALAVQEMRLRRTAPDRLQWPVVSVGNLSMGGAGKTPLTVALARALRARGLRVDVLSRGYGRRDATPARVLLDGTAEEFGDEPLLIARQAGVPVYVASRRYEAGLLAEAEPGGLGFRPERSEHPSGAKARIDSMAITYGLKPVPFIDSSISGASEAQPDSAGHMRGLKPPPPSVHLLDDGFQHRRLRRDVDILILNREDWHGGLLPAGNLREPRSAIRRASVIAIPADEPGLETELKAFGWRGPVWRLRRVMDIPAIDGPLAACCGIARPEQFFRGLDAAGLRLVSRAAFRDHHRYTASDVNRLIVCARAAGATSLITTEKDLVRLGELTAAFPESLPLRSAGLRVEIEDEDAAVDWLVARIVRPT